MDEVRKVQEEVIMRLTKVGEEQVHGNPADISKAQLSSFNRCRDIKDLKIACREVNAIQDLLFLLYLLQVSASICELVVLASKFENVTKTHIE